MLMKLLIPILVVVYLTTTTFAMDPACIAGGCEQESQQSSPSLYETDEYKCVCPSSRSAVETFLDAMSILFIPLKILARDYNFTSDGISIERLIKSGCTCKKKESQPDVETNVTENIENKKDSSEELNNQKDNPERIDAKSDQ